MKGRRPRPALQHRVATSMQQVLMRRLGGPLQRRPCFVACLGCARCETHFGTLHGLDSCRRCAAQGHMPNSRAHPRLQSGNSHGGRRRPCTNLIARSAQTGGSTDFGGRSAAADMANTRTVQ